MDSEPFSSWRLSRECPRPLQRRCSPDFFADVRPAVHSTLSPMTVVLLQVAHLKLSWADTLSAKRRSLGSSILLSSMRRPFPNRGLSHPLSDVPFASLAAGSFCRSLATVSSALLLAGQALQVDSAGVLLIAAPARAELSPIPSRRALVCMAENLPVSLVKPGPCFCSCSRCRLRSVRHGD